ncbi:hypothetical protein QR77_01065 [Streptomyces sp. 150FB]|uniref:hypothetical protein n=1 Tax=Streptomyces sp. 150FB TaxID=1576605 RepID=UPI0005896D63|nr:hypothetical protein [Streptomyces sp. 150FB]KIF72967.1 hypothetical protein QR77_01065 [Streptomyces sp. 150FB]
MTLPLPSRSNSATRKPVRRAVVASVLVLCGLAGASACGKSIQITDSGDKPAASSPAAPAPASSTPPPAAAGGGQPAGNSALQVVDSTAAQNGKTGTGGTVIGAAIQETPPKWVQFSAVQSPDLGTHLINVNQATLYRFDKDTAKPSASNCNDDCAATWPPVTIVEGGNVYLAGVDPKQVGAVRRQDGQVQVTVGGWPVYRYSGDNGPGDANGQGIGGTWFAVGPTGEKSAQ